MFIGCECFVDHCAQTKQEREEMGLRAHWKKCHSLSSRETNQFVRKRELYNKNMQNDDYLSENQNYVRFD